MKAEVVVKEEEVVKEAVVRAMAAVVSQADPPRRGAKAGKCKPSAFFSVHCEYLDCERTS